ncbi:T9SS type A sorting domain-containing protein [Flavobacterium sp. ANB]|uniref:T9SS type A sorting domain-containing protein n=1 Tax=unclassified Flavobacterium TaxID=196869 RepID=UPI0012B848E0|nr:MULTISPECIES: T9SS type A sorting domain-containing protein [unclassified Flavobacterium]MBF4517299.1 T9SS type A sorting domain-containing protein [Flavobacterium sp. ANB]MTD70676.1 T9SS type A sorting domain-containing protein [Flavobacterium sp. LC2016-13]
MRSTLLYVFFLLNFQFAFCQWVKLDTGLTDDLTGVVFLGNNGLASSSNGLYYTTDGDAGNNWRKFEITDNAKNAEIYQNTSFNHCYSLRYSTFDPNFAFACGYDKITHKAIIIKIAFPSMAYEIMYVGETNSSLNNITYYQGVYYAVGDNGLIVKFNSSNIIDVKNISTDNFSSISIYSDRCKISAADKILYSENFNSEFNFVNVLTPGSNNKSVYFSTNGFTHAVGNGYTYTKNAKDAMITNTNYDFGSLNGNAITESDSNLFIATDHGIFKGSIEINVLEWQPSSLKYNITNFFKNGNVIYAFGKGGVILKTTNFGGTTNPFIKLNAQGGCLSTEIYMYGTLGSITQCKWFVDDVLLTTEIRGNLRRTFTKTGDYKIKLVGINSAGVETSDTKTIKIVAYPEGGKKVTISDYLLCKNEKIEVEIADSQQDITYIFRKNGDGVSYGSALGNGGTLKFTTDFIDLTGDYYIEAKNMLGPCSAEFTQKYKIVVEETKADFHKDLINAKQNETVTFYQKANEAVKYKWAFSPNASLTTAEGAQQTLSFANLGETKVNMDVWSINDCYDATEKEGPYIYKDSENTSNCWTLVNDGVDSQWNGFEYEGNYGLTQTDDGFLVSGGFNDQIFDSKIGLKSNFKNKKGSFLTKYDRKGALKWIVSTEHDPTVQERDIIFSSVVDHDGNIYICGTHEGTFIDNKGDRIRVSPLLYGSRNNGYIMKMDKQGKMIWRLNSDEYDPLAKKLYIDKDNNLVTTISLNYQYSDKHQLYLNGIKTTVITQTMATSQADNLTLLKISPLGAVIWYAGITLYHVNNAGIVNLGFDSTNNIYLGGNYEFDMNFYSAGNTTKPEVLKGFEGYGSKMFLVKYNKDGILQWKTRSSTVNGKDNNVSFGAMVTDVNGNNYITGNNKCDNANAVHSFENANGTITQKNIGTFFLAKVNSAGTCEWITGNKYGHTGGRKIIMDNDKLHIIGGGSGTSTFITSDLKNYDLTISEYDFFLATYDVSGNLKKITANGDNRNHATVPLINIYDFFKAEDDSFYLCANMRVNNYTSFGSNISTNDVDGIVSHFDENCGIVKYESTLSTDDFAKTSNAAIYPNPTSGKIAVDLQNYSGDVTVQLYDSNGKKLKEEKASNLTKLDLTINGSQGLYFVKVKTGESTQTFKVLKK